MNYEELQRQLQKLEDIFQGGYISQAQYFARKRELEVLSEISEDSPSYDANTVNIHNHSKQNKNVDIYFNQIEERGQNGHPFLGEEDVPQREDKKKKNKYTRIIEREDVENGDIIREYYLDREKGGVIVYQKNMYGNIQTLPFSPESTLSEVLKRFGIRNGFLVKLDTSRWEPPQESTTQDVWYSDQVKLSNQLIIDQLDEQVPPGHYVIVQKRKLVHRGWMCRPDRDIVTHSYSRQFSYTGYFAEIVKGYTKRINCDPWEHPPKPKYQLPQIPQSLSKVDSKNQFLWFCLRMRILEEKHNVTRHAVRLLNEIRKCQEGNMCFICKHSVIYGTSLFCGSHQDELVDKLFQDAIQHSEQWHSLLNETVGEGENNKFNRRRDKVFLVDPKDPQFLKQMKKLGHKVLE